MIMTVMIIVIAGALVAVILTQATNSERGSGRGANWNEALQAADAGVEEAIARMQADYGHVPAAQPLTGATADGEYSVTVVHLGRNRYQIDSIGSAGQAQGLERERHVRVVMAPPKSFLFALFSLNDIDTKNNDTVNGDVWANGNVTVQQNDEIYGDVTAANGFLTMYNGSYIEGDVETGYHDSGVAMRVNEIGGNAKASSREPNCTDDPTHTNYQIVGGSIGGNAQTWGSLISSNVDGQPTVHQCTLAPQSKPMPGFIFNPLNYDPSPTTHASVAAFQTYISLYGANFSGVHYVVGAGVIDLNGVRVAADSTIIADDAQMWSNGVEAANHDDKLFILVSRWKAPDGAVCTDNGGNPDQCAIGMKNNFQPNDNTATLIYAPFGPVAFKNNAEFDGAVYGSNIVLKNNMTVTYDPRVEQIVGFGPVTLERESWLEISD